MLVSVIVAVAENNVIGKDNQLLWHLPNDLKFFKNTTSGHHILMGRKTFESIGKPLPNRTSLIISSNQNLKIEGCHVFNSLKEALNFAKLNGEQELFIVGGAQIYDLAFSLADKIYLTKINANFNGDAYFPSIDFAKWEKVKETFYEKDEKNPFSHSFVELIKKI